MTALALGPLGVRTRKAPTLLPVGARIAFLGDSIFQFNHASGSAAAGPLTSQSVGEVVSAQMINPAFRCDVWLNANDTRASRYFSGANQGIINDTISSPGPTTSPNGMLGRLATDILPLKPDICIVAGGTNNVTANNNLSGLETICSTLLANGIRPVLCTVRPWTAARNGDGTGFQQSMLTLNAAIRTFAAATSGVTLCDLAAAYGCPGPSWTYANANYFNTDGLHPSAQGGYIGGAAISAALSSVIQSGNWFLTKFWMAGTNLVPAPLATLAAGTTGGKGADITGPIASGLNCYAYTTSTAVASLVANSTTGGMSQQLLITPGGTATTESLPLSLQSLLAGVVPGTYYMAFAEVEFDNWAAWAGVALTLREAPGGNSLVTYGMQPGDVTKTTLPVASHLWISTNPYQTSSAATGLNLSITPFFVPNGATGTGTFKLHRWGVFAIPDPHVIWNS